MTETIAKPRVPFMISNSNGKPARVSILLNGSWRSYLLASDQGQKLAALLREEEHDIEAIGELADIATWITKRSHGRVTVDEVERLRLDGELIDYGLTGRVSKIIEQGMSFESLANFIERLSRNPDQTVKDDLYRFIEKGSLPLDPEGYILGFKKVDAQHLSFNSGSEEVQVWEEGAETPKTYTGRVLYPLNGRVEMRREDCDPNRQRTCSRGLHVCSYEYLNFWYKGSGVVLIVRVDPEHVTAIPADHNDQKLRCCKLEIVGTIAEEEAKNHFAAVVDQRYPVNTPPEPEAAPAPEPVLAEEDDPGEEPTAPADAVNDRPEGNRLGLRPADDETSEEGGTEADVAWGLACFEDGKTVGLQDGAEDKLNGYAYDPSPSFPDSMDDDDLPGRRNFSAGYLEGYDEGWGSTEPGDWTVRRATQAGADAGGQQATDDFPQYDNDVDDASELQDIIAWVEARFPDLTEPEEHPVVVGYMTGYRDAYHARHNTLRDAERLT